MLGKIFGRHKADVDTQSEGWERRLLLELASEASRERRAARRWGNFFKLLGFGYLVLILVLYTPDTWKHLASGEDDYTALIEMKGAIGDGAAVNAADINAALQDAFEDEQAKGVILRINSPGGSPVQSGLIHDEMLRLRKEYPDKPLHVVVTDMCASGGYYVAVAADRIYVDKASIVGSIGVIMNGFGVQEAMEKIGVEPRLLTAGEHKAILNPFQPFSEFDRQHLGSLLSTIHQQFIKVVREGRGERLKEDEETFSGLFWTGEDAVERGLADALGSADSVARDVIGAEELVDFSYREDLLARWTRRMGASLASGLMDAMSAGVSLR